MSPSELEALLLQHPAVRDVGVVGKPDPLVGELPTAFVVKKPGVHVTQKELVDFVAGKVSFLFNWYRYTFIRNAYEVR